MSRPYLLLFALPFLGCSSPADRSSEHVNVDTVATPGTKHISANELIDRLIGEWSGDPGADSTIFHEQWVRNGPRDLKGLGFVMLGKDTVSIEHLNIQITDSGTFYAAEIPAQNEGIPVYFELQHGNDSLVFVNEKHDFPQRIVYRPTGPTEWTATVSGDMEGVHRSMKFHLMERE